jgi:glycosyltransferase involved in cell wall biosynthesis
VIIPGHGSTITAQKKSVAMQSTEDVSIVLVVYNRAQFLARTLECLLRQSYPHFELMICDDASTDGTDEVCRNYAARDPRIRYIRNYKNMGMPGNLNNGIQLARHELIAILHDGDIYEPDLIESWRAALLDHPSAGFVFNQYVHLAPDGKSGAATGWFPEFMSGSEFLENYVFPDREVEFPVWGTVMGRRSIYMELGLFDPRFSFWSDVDMCCRIAEQHDVAYVRKPLIRLPSRLVMPHLFSERMLAAHINYFRIHWLVRKRHYRHQQWKKTAALTSMATVFVSSRSYKLARRYLRRLGALPRPVITADAAVLQK